MTLRENSVTTILKPDNRMFTLARQGKRQPSALEAIAVVLAVLVLVLIPSEMLTRLVIRSIFQDGIASTTDTIVQNVTGFLPIYLSLWVWLRWSSKRPFRTLGLEKRDALPRALGGALVAGLMIAVTAVLAIIAGAEPVKSQTSGITALGIGLLSLLAYLVQGPAEEVLFRGWLLPVIGARYRPWIGVLVSSAVFSLAHATSSGITLLAFLNLLLFGIFAAVYALAEGGLWGICVWHAVWNWAQGDLLGFALDGTPHSGLLTSIRASGLDLITGGAFGLEGGLAATAVLVIAIGTIATISGRRAPLT